MPHRRRRCREHRVSTLHCSTKSVADARVGRLDLDCVVLTSLLSRQLLLMLHPVPGTETSDRLSRLHLLISGGVSSSPP
ncbi:MmyB family transcriptional regulator [Streptomyces griseoaurantiacus]|uniref:MmyB family transcriptional regulator n=1 Tax=Streptomyces griseoaurantiacus TaxID=68213 RepID=UPI0038654F0D